MRPKLQLMAKCSIVPVHESRYCVNKLLWEWIKSIGSSKRTIILCIFANVFTSFHTGNFPCCVRHFYVTKLQLTRSRVILILEKVVEIQRHPDLAGRLASEGKLTHESASEQKTAGLDSLTPEQKTIINRNNERWVLRPICACLLSPYAYLSRTLQVNPMGTYS